MKRLKRCAKVSRQLGISRGAKVLILILIKKTLRFFLVEFWDSLDAQKKYLKWRLANSGESVNNSIAANLFEPPIFKVYEPMPEL